MLKGELTLEAEMENETLPYLRTCAVYELRFSEDAMQGDSRRRDGAKVVIEGQGHDLPPGALSTLLDAPGDGLVVSHPHTGHARERARTALRDVEHSS